MHRIGQSEQICADLRPLLDESLDVPARTQAPLEPVLEDGLRGFPEIELWIELSTETFDRKQRLDSIGFEWSLVYEEKLEHMFCVMRSIVVYTSIRKTT